MKSLFNFKKHIGEINENNHDLHTIGNMRSHEAIVQYYACCKRVKNAKKIWFYTVLVGSNLPISNTGLQNFAIRVDPGDSYRIFCVDHESASKTIKRKCDAIERSNMA